MPTPWPSPTRPPPRPCICAPAPSCASPASPVGTAILCCLPPLTTPDITAFPVINDAAKWAAWTLQKKIYAKAAARWPNPLEDLSVPHTHAAGNDLPSIPIYVRVPEAATTTVPTVLLLTGLDGYRPDNTVRCDEFLARGWAAVVVEIPGTADCPADSADPEAPERLWSSLVWSPPLYPPLCKEEMVERGADDNDDSSTGWPRMAASTWPRSWSGA